MLHEFAARGSIARTADALGYTPSAVSQQLAALEREAGTALLDRTARSAGLTDAGRRLAKHAERILAMVEEAEADLSAHAAEPSGRVVVHRVPVGGGGVRARAGPVAAGAPEADPAAAAVLARRGAAARPLGRGRGGHRRRLDRPDGGLRSSRPGKAGPDGADSADRGHGVLTYYHLLRDPLVLVVERGHPAADPERPVDLRALRNEPWLAAPAGEPSRQAVDRLLAAVGVTPPVPSEFEGLGHGREPGRPGPWHRDHAPARGRRLRAPPGRPRTARGS